MNTFHSVDCIQLGSSNNDSISKTFSWIGGGVGGGTDCYSKLAALKA